MIEIQSLNVCYGSLAAVRDASLSVEKGEIVAVLGANGAGKSTLLGTIAGLVKAKSGSVLFEGRPITNLGSHKIVSRGISLIPEGRHVVSGMTVEENLLLGAYANRANFQLDAIYQDLPILREKRRQLAGTLSGGEQQLLAIGRALAADPKFLLIDEPSLGLAPILVQDVYEKIVQLRENGKTILVVEQNARQVLAVCDRAYLMEKGRIVHTGTAAEISQSERLRDVYLG